MAVAEARIAAERARLERLGVVDPNGNLVSRDQPPDRLLVNGRAVAKEWERFSRGKSQVQVLLRPRDDSAIAS